MDTSEILEEIYQLNQKVSRLPGDFTAVEYVEHVRSKGEPYTLNRAEKYLNELVMQGILKTELRYSFEQSRLVRVYFK